MSNKIVLFELSSRNPKVLNELFSAQLMTYGGYTYSEEYTQVDQYEEGKITIMGRLNYENKAEIEQDYWNYAYIEIKIPMLIVPKEHNVRFEIIVKAEETTNQVQIFNEKKLIKMVPLKAREEEVIEIDFEAPPKNLNLLIRPVYPYPRPFSFLKFKVLTE